MLELRKINWWHILFLHYFSLLLQRSSHWDLCCSHDSPALSLCEYLPFRSDIKQFHHRTAGKQNVLMRGLCSPHQNPCPLTFHNLTPQGQNHSQSDYLGIATLCFPSLASWFCHPFPSADTFRPFFLLNVLQLSIFVSSLSPPSSSTCFVSLHSE